MKEYGDTHNFGRRVRPMGKNWIFKPRSTFWEQLFLSNDSEFRSELEQIMADEPIMDSMPRVAFKAWQDDCTCSCMERITVRPSITGCDLDYVLEALGGLIALSAWFGIEDLHRGNIQLGTDTRTGKFLISPVDIETVFNDLRLPSAMGIIDIQGGRQNLAGAASLFSLIRSAGARGSLAIACAYMRTSHRIVSNTARIVKALNATKGIATAPIRMILRNTHDYLINMEGGSMSNCIDPGSLNPAERLQMRRGDVPYFYRTIKDRRIRYFTVRDLSRTGCIGDQRWARIRTKETLPPEKLFAISERNKLLSEDGAMMIAAHFLPKGFQGEIRYRNFFLAASQRAVHIQFNNGTLFKGARNWSDYLLPL